MDSSLFTVHHIQMDDFAPPRIKPSVARLAAIFLKNGALTFGGGDATTAAIQRELVGNKRWLSDREFGTCYAVSRITPGTNLLAFCTAVGWRLLGWHGAFSALLLASIPGAVLLVVLTSFYDGVQRSPLMASTIHAALAATVGIMLASVWILLSPSLRRHPAPTLILVCGSLFLSLYASFSPLEVLAIAAAFGLLVPGGEGR